MPSWQIAPLSHVELLSQPDMAVLILVRLLMLGSTLCILLTVGPPNAGASTNPAEHFMTSDQHI